MSCMLSEITLGRGGGIFLQSTQNVKLIAARSWSKKHCPGTATWQHWQHAAPSQPDGTLLSTYGTWGSCSVPGPTLCKCSSLEEAADLLTGSSSTPPPILAPPGLGQGTATGTSCTGLSGRAALRSFPPSPMHSPKDVLPLRALSPSQPHSAAMSETPQRSTVCMRAP